MIKGKCNLLFQQVYFKLFKLPFVFDLNVKLEHWNQMKAHKASKIKEFELI